MAVVGYFCDLPMEPSHIWLELRKRFKLPSLKDCNMCIQSIIVIYLKTDAEMMLSVSCTNRQQNVSETTIQ